MRSRVKIAAMAVVILIPACQDRDDASVGEGSAPAGADTMTDTQGMAGMQGMPGMQSDSMGMMGRMASHMSMMRGLDADSMAALLGMHRQLVANMIAQMNREMRDMGMAADAGWDATVDSLRTDLIRMPDMSGAELHAAMPDHSRRITRLLEMHQRMMRGMAR